MKVNFSKLLAAVFIIAGSVVLHSNNLEFTVWVLVLKLLGAAIFFYAISKDHKKKR